MKAKSVNSEVDFLKGETSDASGDEGDIDEFHYAGTPLDLIYAIGNHKEKQPKVAKQVQRALII